MKNSVTGVHLIAKVPLPGWCKTRLIPQIGSSGAATLHLALLRDQIQALEQSSLAYQTWVGFPSGFDMPTLLNIALRFGIADFHWKNAVFVGSDAPLPVIRHLIQACHMLDKDQAVLGPAEDGGVYLIGVPSSWREPFQGVEWGTNAVCRQLQDNARLQGIPHSLLPLGRDVDTWEDLRYLKTQTDVQKLLPCTSEFLSTS